MDPLYILLGSLSVWRITHLFQAEDGSFNLIYSIRKLAGNSFFGTLLDRFYCLSIWVSLPFAIWLGNTLAEIFLLLTSFSGIACLLEKFSTIKNNNYTFKIMSCCGKKRMGLLKDNSIQNNTDTISINEIELVEDNSNNKKYLLFKNISNNSLSVIGSITNKKYTFSKIGDVQVIDARDAFSLMAEPSLIKLDYIK